MRSWYWRGSWLFKGKYICLSLSFVGHIRRTLCWVTKSYLQTPGCFTKKNPRAMGEETQTSSIRIFRNSGISVLTRQVLCTFKYENYWHQRTLWVLYLQECGLCVPGEVKRPRTLKWVEGQMDGPGASLSYQQSQVTPRSSKVKIIVPAQPPPWIFYVSSPTMGS